METLQSLDRVVTVQLFAILAGVTIASAAFLGQIRLSTGKVAVLDKYIGLGFLIAAPAFFLFGLTTTLLFDSVAEPHNDILWIEVCDAIFTVAPLLIGLLCLCLGLGSIAYLVTGRHFRRLSQSVTSQMEWIGQLPYRLLEVVLPANKNQNSGAEETPDGGDDTRKIEKSAKASPATTGTVSDDLGLLLAGKLTSIEDALKRIEARSDAMALWGLSLALMLAALAVAFVSPTPTTPKLPWLAVVLYCTGLLFGLMALAREMRVSGSRALTISISTSAFGVWLLALAYMVASSYDSARLTTLIVTVGLFVFAFGLLWSLALILKARIKKTPGKKEGGGP